MKFKFRKGWQFYWAYGSNLNVAHMKVRCPGAQKIKPLSMDGGALVFRSVADVVLKEGSRVHGGLWYISPENEEALDRYEGVKSGLYFKRQIILSIQGQPHNCLFYQMAESHGVMPPNEFYLDTIAKGYQDFGLPLEALDRALQESWNDKQVTDRLRARRERRGGALARSMVG